MKIAIASDLHLEFGDLEFDNSSHADVLILSGDILVARDITQHDPHNMRDRRQTEMGFARARSERFHEFFERCTTNFPHVIYVMGNHEYYHSDFATALDDMRRKLAYLSNLYILEREIKGAHCALTKEEEAPLLDKCRELGLWALDAPTPAACTTPGSKSGWIKPHMN